MDRHALEDSRALVAVTILGLWGVVFSAGGCAFQKPTMTFKKVQLQQADFEGATLGVVYTLKNPNPIALRVSSVEYKLEIEDHPVVSGRPPNGLRIAANGSSDLVFPASFRFQDLSQVVEVFLKQKQARYRVSGKVGLGTPIGDFKLPLSYSGTFPIPQIPLLSFGSPRVQNLSLRQAKLIVPLRIVNPNAFSLPIDELSARISVGGKQLSKAQLSLPRALGANESQTVEIPVQVDFTQVGFAVAQSMRKRNVSIQLEGFLRSKATKIPFSISDTLPIH